MEFIEINLIVFDVLTLNGKKHRYRLSDTAYGEYLIFKDNQPEFYLNVFDDSPHLSSLPDASSIYRFIESRLKTINPALSLKQHLYGLRISKEYDKVFRLKKLDIDNKL